MMTQDVEAPDSQKKALEIEHFDSRFQRFNAQYQAAETEPQQRQQRMMLEDNFLAPAFLERFFARYVEKLWHAYETKMDAQPTSLAMWHLHDLARNADVAQKFGSAYTDRYIKLMDERMIAATTVDDKKTYADTLWRMAHGSKGVRGQTQKIMDIFSSKIPNAKTAEEKDLYIKNFLEASKTDYERTKPQAYAVLTHEIVTAETAQDKEKAADRMVGYFVYTGHLPQIKLSASEQVRANIKEDYHYDAITSMLSDFYGVENNKRGVSRCQEVFHRVVGKGSASWQTSELDYDTALDIVVPTLSLDNIQKDDKRLDLLKMCAEHGVSFKPEVKQLTYSKFMQCRDITCENKNYTEQQIQLQQNLGLLINTQAKNPNPNSL